MCIRAMKKEAVCIMGRGEHVKMDSDHVEDGARRRENAERETVRMMVRFLDVVLVSLYCTVASTMPVCRYRYCAIFR